MKTYLFVFLICFWTMITVLSSIFAVQLGSRITEFTDPDERPKEEGLTAFISTLFDSIQDIPIIGYFVPLFRLMTFSYTTGVPVIMSIILDAIGLFTVYVMFSLWKGG